MNNHETYVSVETAKLLKRAGFDWEADTYYQHGILRDGWCSNKNKEDMITCSAPTLSVAQKWLREVKGVAVNVTVFLVPNLSYRWQLRCVETKRMDVWHIDYFDTYEEAQEAGINKALKIILKKGE